jgi:hypothetical protein
MTLILAVGGIMGACTTSGDGEGEDLIRVARERIEDEVRQRKAAERAALEEALAKLEVPEDIHYAYDEVHGVGIWFDGNGIYVLPEGQFRNAELPMRQGID